MIFCFQDQTGGRKGTKSVNNSLDTLIGYAEKLNLLSLAESLEKNKEINKLTFLHNQCRTKLRNGSSKRLSTSEYVYSSAKILSTILESKRFDVKTQMFLL